MPCDGRQKMCAKYKRLVQTYLGAVQPLNVPHSPPDLTLLLLRASHLLLLLGAELHVVLVALGVAYVRCASRTRRSGANIAANIRRTRSRVFEAVHVDSEMTLVSHASISNVPLLRA